MALVLGFSFAVSAERKKSSEATDNIQQQELKNLPPPLPREFRAAWVATIANIDWPSKPGLSSGMQQEEFIQILNRAVELKLNALVMQVRPQCDAFYASKIEPWSPYLNGKMGKPPEPFYDPLEFAVTESHKRGIELHAWFNPFRANKKSKNYPLSENHVSKVHPEIVRDYGTHLWLDPGEPAAREYSAVVILDVVKRYDIDGIHFDDYFYPYKEKDEEKKLIPFPDDQSFQKYTDAGGKLNRSDWRRDNVNQFIEMVHASVKKMKPWVKVGAAPFGIWRPGYPAGVKGMDPYEELACDSRKWLQQGWLDYVAPQLYWRTEAPAQPFVPLLKWWVEQNTLGRNIWPGHFDSEIGDKDAKTGEPKMTTEDIISQILLTRKEPGASGNIHYSMKALMNNRGKVSDRLAAEVYTAPAVIPASPWLNATAPAKPKLSTKKRKGEMKIGWKAARSEKIFVWALQKKNGADWSLEILPADQKFVVINIDPTSKPPEAVALTAVNRYGTASAPAVLEIKP